MYPQFLVHGSVFSSSSFLSQQFYQVSMGQGNVVELQLQSVVCQEIKELSIATLQVLFGGLIRVVVQDVWSRTTADLQKVFLPPEHQITPVVSQCFKSPFSSTAHAHMRRIVTKRTSSSNPITCSVALGYYCSHNSLPPRVMVPLHNAQLAHLRVAVVQCSKLGQDGLTQQIQLGSALCLLFTSIWRNPAILTYLCRKQNHFVDCCFELCWSSMGSSSASILTQLSQKDSRGGSTSSHAFFLSLLHLHGMATFYLQVYFWHQGGQFVCE